MLNYEQQLTLLITNALSEDIGVGDHSTLSSISPEAQGSAVLRIKEDGILAGVAVAEKIFSMIEPGIVFQKNKEDGSEMKYGETAFTVYAHVHTILKCERLVLNCMQRMSGIATLTGMYTDKLKGFHTKLLDTRKTTPNFRLLEKEAVRIGGGVNHRFGLYDMIMLKDNHIDYCGGIEKAIEKARAPHATRLAEIVGAFALAETGQYSESIAVLKAAPGAAGVLGHIGYAYARAGNRAEAESICRELQQSARKEGVGAYEVAFIYGALGKKD